MHVSFVDHSFIHSPHTWLGLTLHCLVLQAILENASKLLSPLFWFTMTITGIMGFAIGLVTVMQVKATSPLTHNISGTAKAAVQSLMAFWIWGNEATFKGVLGIFLVIFGSGLYTWVQMNSGIPPAKKRENEGGGTILPK